VPIVSVEPWKDARWDAYVASHPRATVYHTGDWIRIVCEVGRYPSLCLLAEGEGGVRGVLPLVAVDSRLTGRRVSTLPFSDVCFALADDAETAAALLAQAKAIRAQRGAAYYEMRGLPALRDGSDGPAEGFAKRSHFYNFVVPLSGDPEAVRATFRRKVRKSIAAAAGLGVTIRPGGAHDLDTFYALYVRNRRRHGIPPQPKRLFAMILQGPGGGTRSALYFAEYEGRALGTVLTLRYRGVSYGKYEGADDRHRELDALYPLIWRTIEDAAIAGDHTYDFGRTAADHRGLCEFKRRWGTRQVDIPYYFDPPREGLSVVRGDSLKYRLFTAFFRRMPEGLTVRLGARIFRHFG
jgi:hypothetical protein